MFPPGYFPSLASGNNTPTVFIEAELEVDLSEPELAVSLETFDLEFVFSCED